MSKVVGIDPGVSGAIAILQSGGHVVFYDTPTLTIKTGKSTKHVIDAHAAARTLKSIKPDFIVIERVWAMPGAGGAAMGVSSAFNFGCGFGIWLGIIAALEIPHEQVPPQAWKKATMPGMGKEKDASRQRAMQLFPQTAKDLNLKKHHGRADALLLAYYHQMHHTEIKKGFIQEHPRKLKGKWKLEVLPPKVYQSSMSGAFNPLAKRRKVK